MSPEQVRGDQIDDRSALFGLGCVLYAICTGHPPFRADTGYAVLRRITDDTPRSIRETNPDVPKWLEHIVMRLLSKSPDQRYQSAEEVAVLLESCLSHVQQPANNPLPKSLVADTSDRTKRSYTFKIAAVAACVLVVVLTIWFFVALPDAGGTLTVEIIGDSTVPIRILRRNEVVQERLVGSDAYETQLAVGRYDLKIPDVGRQYQIDGSRFIIARDSHATVIVTANDTTLEGHSSKTGALDASEDFRLDDLPDEAEVHVVGCYGAKDNQPVTVRVRATGKPMVVVASAYNEVGWDFEIDEDADVRAVIISGYFVQHFSNRRPSSDIPTKFITYFPVWDGIRQAQKTARFEKCFFPWSPLEADGFEKMSRCVREITDRATSTFQSRYFGSSFDIDGEAGELENAVARRHSRLQRLARDKGLAGTQVCQKLTIQLSAVLTTDEQGHSEVELRRASELLDQLESYLIRAGFRASDTENADADDFPEMSTREIREDSAATKI